MTVHELNHLHDEALRRAHDLRDDAIDDFWRGANAVLWAQLSSARRAAARLSQRLQHHRQLRQAPAAPAHGCTD